MAIINYIILLERQEINLGESVKSKIKSTPGSNG